MLLQYFGFKEEPFGVNPDPRCLFLSRTHQQALDALGFAFANNRGFTAMIAPPGMGKTTLLFRFLEDIRDAARVVFLFDLDPQCEPREFVAYILRDLGIVPAQGSAEMHEQLSNAVINENRAFRKFVIVIDEAQNLSDAVLERVRLLTNFETSRGKLIQIVLSGQSQLSEKLQHVSLVQLRQRISTVCHIEPLSLEETVGYIDYRVKMAGYLAEPLFTAGAVKLISEASHGTPRTINNLCYNSLALCSKMKLKQVDSAMVSKVIAGLQLTPPSHQPAAAPAVPAAAAREQFQDQPRKRQQFTGLQLIPSLNEPVAPAPIPVAARADAPVEKVVANPVISDFYETSDEHAKPKFWQRTKMRVLHILPATTGSVMLWVPSAAIILVVSFLGVLRLSEVWAPQPHSTDMDQTTVLAPPPSAPAPDGSDPSAATESSAPSDPGSPASTPAAAPVAPKPMQASANIPKPSPAIASPAAPAPKSTHVTASVAKPSASARPSASTAKLPSASMEPSASISSGGHAPVAMPDVAHPAVMVSAQPSGQNASPATNSIAAQHNSTSAAPTANAPKQVRAALSSNLPNAPVAVQPSATPSVRPALPQNSH